MLFSDLSGPANSPLARVNPVIKLVAFCAFVFAPAFFLDPYTPLAFLLLAWGAAWPLARVAPWRLLWQLRPYLLLVVWLALFNALFYAGDTQGVLWQSGPLHLSPQGVEFGAAVALRLLCMITYTFLYFTTTEPILLVNSLILQARLPYKLAFTILATYRFLPILQQEMALIGAAQRIRAVNAPYRAWSPQSLRRFTIPLLAGGIRRAERLALAMDGRGFGAEPARTYAVQPRVEWGDLLFLAGALMVTLTILLTLARLHLLNGWLVGVAERLSGGQ
jgi:energy-coupling factor transport system permease protein